jgi:tetratricopeptide (TPR) repeat protein
VSREVSSQGAPSDVRSSAAWRTRAAVGLIAATALAAYGNSFAGVFVLDDHLNIVGNARLRELLPSTWPPWTWADSGLAGRPLTAFTFALNWAWSADSAWSYHALNLAVHAACGVLLWLVLRRTLTDLRARGMWAAGDGAALAGALLWTAHPLGTAAVTYIVQRCESLMVLFFLAAFHAAQVALATGSRRWTLWATGAAWLGAASKEGVVVLPLVVLAYAVAVRGDLRAQLAARRKLWIGLVSCWIPLALLTLFGGGHGTSVGFSHPIGPWEYLQSQTLAIPHYARLAVWPEPLLIDYGWWRPAGLPEWLVPGLALLALFAASFVAVVRGKPLGFAGAWWFLVLAPSSSVLPIATQLAAEHRAYLPLAALSGAGALLFAHFLRKAPRPARVGLASALALGLVLALGLTTRARNDAYRSEEGLWRQSLARFPDNPRGHTVLGDLLRKSGDSESAREHYRTAVELQPAQPFWRINYGVSLYEAGRFDAAAEQFEEALRRQPGYALAWANLGQVELARQRPVQALEAHRKALALDPTLLMARRGLGFALAETGPTPRAIAVLEKWLEANPADAEVRRRLELLRAAPPR